MLRTIHHSQLLVEYALLAAWHSLILSTASCRPTAKEPILLLLIPKGFNISTYNICIFIYIYVFIYLSIYFFNIKMYTIHRYVHMCTYASSPKMQY